MTKLELKTFIPEFSKKFSYDFTPSLKYLDPANPKAPKEVVLEIYTYPNYIKFLEYFLGKADRKEAKQAQKETVILIDYISSNNKDNRRKFSLLKLKTNL